MIKEKEKSLTSVGINWDSGIYGNTHLNIYKMRYYMNFDNEINRYDFKCCDKILRICIKK